MIRSAPLTWCLAAKESFHDYESKRGFRVEAVRLALTGNLRPCKVALALASENRH